MSGSLTHSLTHLLCYNFYNFWKKLFICLKKLQLFTNKLQLRQLWSFLAKNYNYEFFDSDNDNPRDLWPEKLCFQFWQLRTWIHDNLCDLTIKSDTGLRSKSLRCLNDGFPYVLVVFVLIHLSLSIFNLCQTKSFPYSFWKYSLKPFLILFWKGKLTQIRALMLEDPRGTKMCFDSRRPYMWHNAASSPYSSVTLSVSVTLLGECTLGENTFFRAFTPSYTVGKCTFWSI